MKTDEGWIIFITGMHEEAQKDDLQTAFHEYGEKTAFQDNLNLDSRTSCVKNNLSPCSNPIAEVVNNSIPSEDSKNARKIRKSIIGQRKNAKKFTHTLNISRMPNLTGIDPDETITVRPTVAVLSKEKSVSGLDCCPSSTSTHVSQQNNNSSYHTVSDIASVSEDYWDVGDPTFICGRCGANMWYEERLKKDRKSCMPEFGLCCSNGKVQLPLLKMPPNTLLQLHDNSIIRSQHFLRYIRTYNMIFSFTSFGARVDGSVNEGSGPYCFRVGGQVHHLIGSLIPPDSQSPKFAQLYIYDTENEIDNRLGFLSPANNEDILDPDIVKSLKEILDKPNSIAQSFQYARDRYKEDSFNGVKLRLIRKHGSDGRVYNLPSASEVAALIVGDIDNAMGDRDIIVETQTGLLQHIDVKHPLYLGLQYPLLFPYGEDGYRDDVQRTSTSRGSTNPRSTISMKEFFSFRLQIRSGESQVLHHSRKLFQQFLVDAYTMVEYDRLNFIRHNQNQLREELYKNIIHAWNQGEDAAARTGKRIIIPSSFTGGPRYMAENCKDAFAICRWAGYPHIFITITYNPKWPEITRFLKARNLNPEDRPDILCRVFKFKLDQLLHDLKKEHVLGRVNAYVCTIEFQKRGLPHAYILLFLHPSNKPDSGLDIDKLISAEIPNRETHPALFVAVISYMMHGPCGPNNYKSPCMKEGKCSKNFPRVFVPVQLSTMTDFIITREEIMG
ncbi:uncharacterized protein LOC133285538 [Gastrolobium bilobum]|uniref:uncharacterized protein LOC133285538 n=1 Tax=Gastrolobium bilobum TaxID=150636 RepID=UPI002AB2BF10|nr:uncharacterized protein LOC133285538 [Gastrolobium bilobum]